MHDSLSTLRRIRQLRLLEDAHRARAAEHLSKACRGMGRHEAARLGGTNRCPLTDHALAYADERDRCLACAGDANTLWNAVKPRLHSLPREHRRMLCLYYNAAMDLHAIAAQMNKPDDDCVRLVHTLP